MRLVFAVLAGFALTTVVTAGSLPRFDTAAFCAKVGTIGLTQSTIMLDGCIREEVVAKTELTAAWDSLSANEQNHCVTAASFAGDGSYGVMRSCLVRLRTDAALDQSAPASN